MKPYGMEDKMKVLIADDEYHVIQAIQLLVPWEEFGIDRILTASNGIRALEQIEEEMPEIVITDIIMEDMSGMEIMNFIASRCPATKVIAISGHNDFEYVRTMLTKGCTDYLLKPLEAAALISTVQGAAKRWRADQESSQRGLLLQEKIHSLSDFYSGVLLYKMLDSREKDTVYQELLEADSKFSSISSCKVLYYDSNYFPVKDGCFSLLMKKFEDQVKLLFQSGCGMFFLSPDRPGETALLLYKSIDSAATSVLKLAQSVFYRQPCPFHIGVSRKKAFPECFSETYRQAKNSFLSVYGDIGSSSIVFAVPAGAGENVPVPDSGHLQQLEDQILSALFIGHKNELEVFAVRFLDSLLPERGITLRQIQNMAEAFKRLLIQCTVQIKKKKPSFSYELPEHLFTYEELTEENFLFSRSLLKQAALNLLYDLCGAVKENCSSADVMQQITQYMELNYAKPFVQSEYAKRFFLNKDYMSRKFTNSFGINMLTYLNRIRIRHAKELLGDFSLKIQDIAFSVGFKDEKYFAKQFKKMTGSAPGEYRTLLKAEEQKRKQGS